MKKSILTLLLLAATLTGFAIGDSTNIVVVSESNAPAPYVVHTGTIPAGSPIIAKIASTLVPALDPQAGAVPNGMVPVALTLIYDPSKGSATFTITYQ